MKILVLAPFGKTEPFGREHLEKVARPDTEFDYECLEDAYPLSHNCSFYLMLKSANAAVERVIKAEKQGYDAVVLSCIVDPGLYESRTMVDIPVTGAFESAAHLACIMGKRFSVITTDALAVGDTDPRLIDVYGLRAKVASVRWLGIDVPELYPEVTPPETVANRLVEVGKQCVEEDQAEVIVPGCTIIGSIFTEIIKKDPMEVIGAPVVDPMIAAFKQAEMMVDLCKLAGWRAVSRTGIWRKPRMDDIKQLRKFMKENPSPEQYYY